MLDKTANPLYNLKAVKNAAIAQSVERILGKDEVASSNLASSSKASEIFGFQRFSFAFDVFPEEILGFLRFEEYSQTASLSVTFG